MTQDTVDLKVNIPYDTGISVNNRKYNMDNLYEQMRKLSEGQRLLVIKSNDAWDGRGINLEHVVGIVSTVKHDDKELVCSVKQLKTRPENPDLKGMITIGGSGHLSEPDENGVRTVRDFLLSHVALCRDGD